MNLSDILKTIQIGPVKIDNRIVRTGHATYFSSDRYIGGEDLIAYHEARARDGCGLTILEAGEVHYSSCHGSSIDDDRVIGDLRALVDAVRPYGMRVFQQLWHAGNIWPSLNGPQWGVSTVAGPWGGVPFEMTTKQIDELIASYVAAARRCREAGLDGVEIHAGHGYLPMQFLSPAINTREDGYGGSLENRMRFLKEVLVAVRQEIGPDLALGTRMSASVFPGVLDTPEVLATAQALESEGLIDYLNVSFGDYYRTESTIPAMQAPMGVNLPWTEPVTAVLTRIPRIIGGRVRTLEEANQLIRDGSADMVSLVRAHIADPTYISKTLRGEPERARPCIACNQGCIGGVFRDHRVSCVVNPAVGRERTMSEELIRLVRNPKRVMVIGGGPAGMEAARVAALMGHRVVLAEAMPDLGGAINVAKLAPYLHTIGDITVWLEEEIYRLGVEVRLNNFIEAGDIRAEAPDFLIVATGSQPRMDGVQPANPSAPARGVHLPHVLSSTDLLTTPLRDCGRSALVVDSVGQYEAIAVTDYLLARGVAVTFLSHDFAFATNVRASLRDDPALQRFYQGDFNLLIRHMLAEVRPGECDVRPVHGKRVRTVPADTVVLLTPNQPARELYLELRGEMPGIALVGDASSPRDLQAAIAEGHAAARALLDDAQFWNLPCLDEAVA